MDRRQGNPRTTKDFKKSNPDAQKKFNKPKEDLPDPKERKLQKREKKSKVYSCDMSQLLQIFEQARQANCENRDDLLKKAFAMLERNFQAAALSNTEGRILCLFFEYGTLEQQAKIASEVQKIFFQVCTSKYGYHLAIKMLKINTNKPQAYVTQLIETEVLPNLTQYSSQVQAIQVVNHIFANSSFYRMKIMQQIAPDLLANELQFEQNIKPIMKLINTALSKDLIASPFIQKLISKIFDAYAKLKSPKTIAACEFEIKAISSQIEPASILLLIDKPDGVKIACQIYALQPPKAKQQIIHQLKQKLLEISLDPIASTILYFMFMNTDDTKFLSENLLVGLRKNVAKMQNNLSIFQFLCCGFRAISANKIFNGNVKLLEVLRSAEALWNPCKKDVAKREAEVFAYFKAVFGDYFTPEKVYALSLEDKNNGFLNALLAPQDVAQNYCKMLDGEYVFRHNVAHYGLNMFLKQSADAALVGAFLEQFQDVPADNFVKRGAFVLKALSALDKAQIVAFVGAKGVCADDKVIQGLLQAE
ncbi:hypothetical protein SS50377_24286 [Spironucleus salmonicida]|uniref:Uncharacterized protein n=1 Tax=Spironucleus salmonicida TaxID=348837 RepID=V6LM93_9EUKA|nr:hypothetical protein SS50377_24286 [Spironucleus salmonicida]|eukprot:EST44826.1 Hypothetical protein SS50377_15272 [Spironucleus salmonicida]